MQTRKYMQTEPFSSRFLPLLPTAFQSLGDERAFALDLRPHLGQDQVRVDPEVSVHQHDACRICVRLGGEEGGVDDEEEEEQGREVGWW